MVEVDFILGELAKALQETGQIENTLVFLTSDNGPECELPPHGRSPFRGCKGSTWEGGVRVPTFAYWQGTIKPRKSDGLFDLADLLPTIVSMAGHPGKEITQLFAATTYIDGVDQASFLIADNGQSARRSRPYTLNQYFSAMRVDEFKFICTAELEGALFQRGYIGGFSGGIVTDTGGVIHVNLYTDPQEDVNVGIRHIPAAGAAVSAAGWYMQELLKYPPQFKVGFLSNNPPVYDLLPRAREAIEKWRLGNRPEAAH
jgi:arylsulfatase A-like enzyme